MGIAHRLALLSSSSFSSPKLNVTVVEADSRAVDKAVAAGYPVVLASDVAAVHAAVSACFAVVTATGVAAVISSHYNPSVFLSPRLDGGTLRCRP